ncbi:MAG: ABC-2 family transporter protein [Pseudomonadales bacterium]|nr:ABC-2 family transporter protein [Candidatus Woesebacteria bacterium]MCB9801736.1 ABC-2 family transporter protein [Pseudomonadales bacterium]
MKKYAAIWFKLASNELQQTFVNKWTNLLFLLGKLVRLATLILLIVSLEHAVPSVAGFQTQQLRLFVISYTLIDTVSQLIFRGVYVFSNSIRTGSFDLDLSQPINPLFRALFGKPDIGDMFFLIPLGGVSAWLLRSLIPELGFSTLLLSGVVLLDSLLIAAAFHIFVLCLGIITTEVNNTIMLYRDVSRFGMFPVAVYPNWLSLLFRTLIPLAVLFNLPAEVMGGLVPSVPIGVSVVLSVSFFSISLLAWKRALKEYSSASS